jgi:UDP-N-acetylmuramyl pentapeptide phosphotransferase/UDP-N-acetylglucosamine-1-phosphate transferase
MSSLTSAAIAAALVLAFAPVLRGFLARARVVDVPNDRSSHVEETIRGGGVAVGLGCALAGALSTQIVSSPRMGLLLVAGGMGLVGLVDDIRPSPPVPRLIAQAVIAAASSVWLCKSLHGSALWQGLLWVGACAWIITYVNAFNFMDGINGISVAQATVAGLVWFGVGEARHVPAFSAAGIIVAAAAAAFAPFNLRRSHMFLGDVGSYFLGAWLAAAAVIGVRAHIPPEAVLAPLALYCADTLTTLFGRLRRGEPLMEAHREHAYQRLVQAGWSHNQASLAVGLVIALCGGFGTMSLTASAPWRVIGDGLVVLVVVSYLANPVSRRSPDERSDTSPPT